MRRQHTAGLWEPCHCWPMASETHPSEHTPADGGDGASRMEPAAPAMPALSHGHCSEPLLLGRGPRFSSCPVHHTAGRSFLLVLALETAHANNLYTQFGFWKGRHGDMQLTCYLGSGAAGAACWAVRGVLLSCSQWNLMVLSWYCVLACCSFLLASGTAILSSHTLRDVATKALFLTKDLFFDCSSYKVTVYKRKSTTLCMCGNPHQWRAKFCWTHLFLIIIQGSFPFLMTSLFTHLAASSRGLAPCSWNYILNCTWIVSPKSVSLEFARSSWKFPDKAFLIENSLKVLSSTLLLQPAILRDEQHRKNLRKFILTNLLWRNVCGTTCF